jgi:hypothetical protein
MAPEHKKIVIEEQFMVLCFHMQRPEYVVVQMSQNGPKWAKMGQNGPKWAKMGQNGPKWAKMGQNGPK